MKGRARCGCTCCMGNPTWRCSPSLLWLRCWCRRCNWCCWDRYTFLRWNDGYLRRDSVCVRGNDRCVKNSGRFTQRNDGCARMSDRRRGTRKTGIVVSQRSVGSVYWCDLVALKSLSAIMAREMKATHQKFEFPDHLRTVKEAQQTPPHHLELVENKKVVAVKHCYMQEEDSREEFEET
jgi:hypothetical protein